MPQVIVEHGVTPCQIDGFPEKCERSRKGALYVRPSSSLEMTNDELAHVKATLPELYKKLRVVEQPRPRARPNQELKNPVPAPKAKMLSAKAYPKKEKASKKSSDE